MSPSQPVSTTFTVKRRCQQVRRRRPPRRGSCGYLEPTRLAGSKSFLTHQPSYPLATAADLSLPKLLVDTRTSVTVAALSECSSDLHT